MIQAIKKDDNDTRLDRWLVKNEMVNSVVEAQKLTRSGKIRVNDEKVKFNSRVFFGDEVECPEIAVNKVKKVKYITTKQDEEMLQDLVIYKDDNVMVINKPAGLAVQGGSGSFKNLDSMLNALRFDKDGNPKLVHRLDKYTSGALVLARNNQSARKLLEYFKAKKVQKTYWAWSLGICDTKSGVVDAPLLKTIGGNEKVIITHNGKDARTRYKVLKTYKDIATLFELNPETGRMHQI